MKVLFPIVFIGWGLQAAMFTCPYAVAIKATLKEGVYEKLEAQGLHAGKSANEIEELRERYLNLEFMLAHAELVTAELKMNGGIISQLLEAIRAEDMDRANTLREEYYYSTDLYVGGRFEALKSKKVLELIAQLNVLRRIHLLYRTTFVTQLTKIIPLDQKIEKATREQVIDAHRRATDFANKEGQLMLHSEWLAEAIRLCPNEIDQLFAASIDSAEKLLATGVFPSEQTLIGSAYLHIDLFQILGFLKLEQKLGFQADPFTLQTLQIAGELNDELANYTP